MPRFLYIFSTFVLLDVMATLFEKEVCQYIIRTIIPFSAFLFYLSQKKQFGNESFFVIFLILITLISDIAFLRFREYVILSLLIVILKELTTIILIYQEPTTVLPKVFNVFGQLLIYLIICLLIFMVLVSSKVAGYTIIGVNFGLMAAVFTLASFRKVNNESFKAVFLGLFLGLFAGIFGVINYQDGYHTFAHVIDRVLNDLGLFFVVYGFIINQQAKLSQ
jgi:hypothetical protein